MKKYFLLLMLAALLPMVAHADAVEINGIYYNLISKGESNVAEVTSNPNIYTGSVDIPETVSYEGTEYKVTSIGSSAFYYSYLTSVTIPNSVTSIGNSAFYDCSSLTSVTIPNSVTSIDKYAFWGCSGLTTVTIGKNVTSIGDRAFNNCSNLTSVNITDLNAWCKISFTSSNSNPLYCALHLYLNGVEIKDLVIPNSVTAIGNYAFINCRGLTSVTIPNSVTSIGECAFSGCSGLASVTIPNSVLSIGVRAFQSCSALTSMTIPNSVTTIGDDAFYGCSGLTSVTIPNSVTTIGHDTFYGCSGLTSVTFPNSVTSIGTQAFYNCSSLSTVAIPNSVTSIGNFAFYNCSGLTTVTIGNGIRSIGSRSFASCNMLSDVYCYAENVPYTYSDAFQYSYTEYATLHVPAASVNAYKQADPWNKFKEVVSLGGDTPEPPVTPKCATPSISYSGKNLTFSCATEGVTYRSSITSSDICDYTTAEVQLTATYEISVYATKTGYDNSDVATATLIWNKANFTETTEPTAVRELTRDAPLLIQSHDGVITIQGADDGQQVRVYGIDGTQAGAAFSNNGQATVGTNLKVGSVAIIKIGERSVKVVVK